uniref:Thioredoxin domain-containing protein n=1 Tax=Neobodo designis TaxID=312471 RepID=A0A7S1LYM7_NEODS|mmetsp:Transcript_30966/g.95629  ORF Transcript_30966/g.95629 Transcript_30966/m.95629 type:complete len:119 (+) Transcript_30966:59-415(+)
MSAADAAGAVRRVTAAEFETLRSSGVPMVVDCFAEWCGPCKTIAPAVERLAVQHPHVTVVTVDVDAEQALAASLKVEAMPTFIAFKDGAEVKRLTGAMESMLKLLFASLPAPTGTKES